MGGSTHIVIGAASAVLVTNPKNTQEVLLATGIGAFGGLIADVDTDNSKISHLLRGVLFSTAILFGILYATNSSFTLDLIRDLKHMAGKVNEIQLYALSAMLLLLLIGTFTKHRRFTHSLEYAVLFAVSSYFFHPFLALPILASMISHIMLDILNYQMVTVSIIVRLKLSLKICKSKGFIDWLMTMFGGVLYGITINLIK